MPNSLSLNYLTIPADQAGIDILGENGWLLRLPPGPAGSYRVAQLDDYHHLPRHRFRWQPPLTFSLTAQVSASD
ncbi:MAG: serine/threonine-protein phosphatase 2A activator, partial [Bellilinea sp.]|nr:serine/threonine-protein phosphatase 2A activator [Bellilinea sp.]